MKIKYRPLLLVLLLLTCSNGQADPDPTVQEFNKLYSSYEVFAKAEDWSSALPFAKQSYEMGKVLFGNDSKNTAALAYNYGLNLKSLGEFRDCLLALKEAVKLYEGIYGKDSAELIPIYMDMGLPFFFTNNISKPTKYYRRALKLAEKHYGEDSIYYGQRSVEIGTELLLRVQTKLAKKYLYNGHRILEQQMGQNSPKTAFAALNVGKYEYGIHHYKTAASYFQKALSGFSSPGAKRNLSYMELTTHGLLVEAYEKMGERDRATKHCLKIGEMTPANDDFQDLRPLVTITPEYPQSAAQYGKDGYVVLEFTVDDSGYVQNPKLVYLEGPKSFANEAMKVVKQYRYAPRFLNGKPVATEGVKHKFTFKVVK